MQCRACMKRRGCVFFDMAYAGTGDDGKNLYEYFNECTQLHASSNDNFPKTLCKTCVNKLQDAYIFRKCAQDSEERFKQLLSQKIKENVYSSTEQLYAFEDMEENTCDPLDMDINGEVEALKEHELDFYTNNHCLEKHSDKFFEQVQKNAKRDINLTDIIEEETNNEITQSAIEIGKEEYESETEPIERIGYFCDVCNCSFSIKNELKKHIAEQHKTEIICIKCSKVFDMPNELKIHRKLVHDTDSPVKCIFCNEMPLMDRSNLLKHFQNNHSSRYFKYFPRLRKRGVNELGVLNPYKCKYCKYIFPTEFELEDHIKKHVYKCPFCEKNFTRIRTYYSHAKRLHSCSASSFPPTPYIVEGVEVERDKPIVCKSCNKSYRNLGSYNTHINQKHKTNCSKFMRTSSVVKVPEKQNKEIQPIKSSIGYVEKGSELVLNEMNKNNEFDKKSELGLKIRHCAKDIKENGDSSKKDIHNETEGRKARKRMGYLCSFCPRILSTRLALESHEKITHLKSQMEFKDCPICQKKFRADYLIKHLNVVHTNERNYQCDICGNAYKSKSRLVQHNILHKERNFPCTVCDKKFAVRSELNVHMRVHTGELPYACHLCDRRFRIKVRLTYHLQHHNNVKLKCNVCGKEYKNGTSLRVHSYEHTGVKPYMCPDCDYKCVKREVFRNHLLRKHDRTMTAEELSAMFKANTGRYPRVMLIKDLERIDELMQEAEYSD